MREVARCPRLALGNVTEGVCRITSKTPSVTFGDSSLGEGVKIRGNPAPAKREPREYAFFHALAGDFLLERDKIKTI